MKQRNDVQENDKWNIEALFNSMNEWETFFSTVAASDKKNPWPEIQAFRGHLHEGAEVIKSCLEKTMETERLLSKLFTYIHLRHDEDIANDKHKGAYIQTVSLFQDYAKACSWIQPELLSLSEEILTSYLSDKVLKDYKFHLEKILRQKKHTLAAEQEELLAMSAKATQAPSRAFSAMNDADFSFGKITDKDHNEHELTHASYGLFLREHDRTLRKNAFESLHKQYDSFKNTLSELLSGAVENHVFHAKARHYQSALEAALYPKNIETSVYDALITAVNENVAPLHRYMALRKKVMKLETLHFYDLYVPLIEDIDLTMDFQQAANLIVESVAPLGPDYQNALQKGLKEARWVDRYENKNKRSGAYSSGCYDSMPYILMNYKGVLRDVFTLAHEAGHSMHSYLSQKTQPYHYSKYPIFLAEVASTFNEALLMDYLLKRTENPLHKAYLINEKIEDIRATLFRQTMFAEFEKLIHEMTENQHPLTPQTLEKHYIELNTKYFGESVSLDPLIAIEWARIPHFYYNFYVYQYATGISAALSLSERVLKGGISEREDYLSFLKSGCSRYPIDTLKYAGVDMRSKEPVSLAIKQFDNLVTELENQLST